MTFSHACTTIERLADEVPLRVERHVRERLDQRTQTGNDFRFRVALGQLPYALLDECEGAQAKRQYRPVRELF